MKVGLVLGGGFMWIAGIVTMLFGWETKEVLLAGWVIFVIGLSFNENS